MALPEHRPMRTPTDSHLSRSFLRPAALLVTGTVFLAAPGRFGMAADGKWSPPPPTTWFCEYTADAVPDKAVPRWVPSLKPNTERTVEQGVLRIVDSGKRSGELHCYRRSWRVDPSAGGLVEARVKVIANDGRSGICILVADGEHEVGLTLYPDRVAVESLGITHKMQTTDDYHVYRIAVRRDDFHLWVDGKSVIDGTGRHTHPAHSSRNCVSFGSISSAAQSEALWDFVRYASYGRLNPPPCVAGARDVVIYKEADVYACFPSLRETEDGTLVTGFGTRTRRSHIDPTGGSATRISRDKGRTWEQPPNGFRAVDPSLRCKDGSLALAGANSWRHVPESRRSEFEERDITVRQVRPGVVAYLQGAYARRSVDGGKTWEKRQLDLPGHRSLMGYNSGARCALRSGVRLVAVYGRLHGDKTGRTFVLRSDDDGKTWWFLPLAADPAGRVTLNETALVENGDGQVIAMMRSEPSAGGHLYQSVSDDGGITWSPPHRTEIWGYPAHLLRLDDGRILCSYGYRRGAIGVRAVLSADGGRTWDTDNVLVIRSDGNDPGSDNGYPISVETEPGEVFTIYYINTDDGVTHVAGTIWNVPKPTATQPSR